MWPRVIETEIGAALCAIFGGGRTFNFNFLFTYMNVPYSHGKTVSVWEGDWIIGIGGSAWDLSPCFRLAHHECTVVDLIWASSHYHLNISKSWIQHFLVYRHTAILNIVGKLQTGVVCRLAHHKCTVVDFIWAPNNSHLNIVRLYHRRPSSCTIWTLSSLHCCCVENHSGWIPAVYKQISNPLPLLHYITANLLISCKL